MPWTGGTFWAFRLVAISSSDIRLPSMTLIFTRPTVVTSVAEQMRQPDVVLGEVPSIGPQSWVVVRRRGPIGARRPRIEVPAAPEAVALRHLATHVDDLAVPGELQEDSANSKGLKLLNSCLSGAAGAVGISS